MEDRLRIESNERIDIRDFKHLTEQADSEMRGLVDSVFVNPDEPTKRTWILDGFAMSNPGAQILQVDLGRAILAKRVGGLVYYGAVTINGDATKSINMDSYSDGSYFVYLRFEDVQGNTESRIFWNPAGDGSEFSQSIATRYQANWSIRIESSSPGNEWTQIGEVSVSGVSLSIDSDDRNFYFEGKVSDSYQSGWSTDGGGGAQDRNSDRATYGVTDLQTFNSAMRQCLEDIKGRGLRSWYSRDIGGMNLGFDADPVEDRLAIGAATHFIDLNAGVVTWQFEANNSLTYDTSALTVALAGSDVYTIGVGGILPIGSRDLGSDASRWDEIYAEQGWIKTYPSSGDAEFTIWGQTTTANEGRTRFLTQSDGEFRIQAMWDNDSAGNYLMRAYRSGSTYDKLEFLSIEGDVKVSFGEPHSGTSNQVEFNAAVVPSVTQSFDLGTDSLQWLNQYAHRAYFESVSTADPRIYLEDANADANAKIWRFQVINDAGNASFRLQGINDVGGVTPVLTINRSGATIADATWDVNLIPSGSKTLGNATDKWALLYASGINVYDIDTLGEGPYIEGARPGIRLENTDLETDEERWFIGMSADMDFVIKGVASASWTTGGTEIFKITRTEDGTTADSIQLVAANEVTIGGSGVNTDVLPFTTNVCDLGSESERWKEIHGNFVHVRGDTTDKPDFRITNISAATTGRGWKMSVGDGAPADGDLLFSSIDSSDVVTDYLRFDQAAGGFQAILPLDTDVNLGGASNYWGALYLSRIYAQDSIRIEAGGTTFGISNTITFTGDWSAAGGSTRSILGNNTNANSGYIKILIDGNTDPDDVYWIPFWTSS